MSQRNAVRYLIKRNLRAGSISTLRKMMKAKRLQAGVATWGSPT